MCSREELLRQLIEEVEEVLEYAKKEFEATVEESNFRDGKKYLAG